MYTKTGAMLFLLAAIAGYSLFQARNLIYGPMVEIHTPQNGATVSESLVSISGIANNIAHISLNGRPIFVDETGRFSEALLLSYGYTIMTIRAEDRFGRTTEKTLELVYK